MKANNSHTAIEHKTLKQSGYDIHYYVSGKAQGETIMFLHPAFSDHRAFELQVDFFSKNYRVITIDLIGHGLSQVGKSKDKIDQSSRHIAEIIEVEGIDRLHLAGVSMGSLVAQYFAIYHPQKVKSLTILGGYDINKVNKEVNKAQRFSNLELMLRALFSMQSFRQKTAKMTAYTASGQEIFFNSSALYTRKSFMVMQGFQNIIKNRDISPVYPILILTGEHDIPLALKMAETMHQNLPHSEYHTINKAGHCANMDACDVFNKLVSEFIESKI